MFFFAPSTNLFEEVVGPEEEGGAAPHDEGPAVDVDHDGPLLLVDLGRVDVEVEAVLVAHGLAGADVELPAKL
jgi:hypothetical protein